MNAMCSLHGTEMKSKEWDNGNVSWSHLVPNVGWCNGTKINPLKTNTKSTSFIDSYKMPVAKQEEKVDWDAKDRQSIAQTAMKSASEIVAAQINAGILVGDPLIEVRHTANELYKELIKMKLLVFDPVND